MNDSASYSELGKKTHIDQHYNPKRLYAIPRQEKREALGIDPNALPFFGFDGWNHYEVSWLNTQGKPIVATAEIFYDCRSPKLIESKSLKLYFNSLNQTKFESFEAVQNTIKTDLSDAIDAPVSVLLWPLHHKKLPIIVQQFEGESIDDLDIKCDVYSVNKDYLTTIKQSVSETLCSDLLKSNCLITNQPDWGSIQIAYEGNQIEREGLLRYLVSFREHNEFHEQCIERIFMDIMQQCQPTQLTVYARYTRRGGLDINPYRSTQPLNLKRSNVRLIRQ